MGSVSTWIGLATAIIVCAAVTTAVARLVFGSGQLFSSLSPVEIASRLRRARAVGWLSFGAWALFAVLLILVARPSFFAAVWGVGAATAALLAVLVGLRDPREMSDVEELIERKDD